METHQLELGLKADGGFLDPAPRTGVVDGLTRAGPAQRGVGGVHFQGGGADVCG